MIEYKVYHKTRSGNRGGGRSVRKKEKGRKDRREGNAGGGARLRFTAWAAAVLVSVALTGAACASAYSWLSRSPLFAVREVDMNRCENVTQEEVWAIVRDRGKGNLWSIPSRELAKRLAEHPWIRSASVRKVFPDRIVVRIGERRPVAMVNLDALYYVDDRGAVFKRLTAYDSKSFPIVTGFSRVDLLSRDAVAMRNFRRALELLRAADAGTLRQNISELHFDPQDGYTLVTRDTGLRLKVGTMESRKAVRRIEEAMPRIARLGKGPAIVDLRTEGRIFVRSGE
jgi:cell division protein FtsQ